jgi:hypothetical protein
LRASTWEINYSQSKNTPLDQISEENILTSDNRDSFQDEAHQSLASRPKTEGVIKNDLSDESIKLFEKLCLKPDNSSDDELE